MICPSRSYHFKIFKVCLPQILLYPFLNTLTHINTKPRGNGNSEYWIYSKFVMLNFAIHILQQMQQIFLLMFYKNLTFRLKTIYRIVFALCKAGFTTESISINASCLSEDRKYMMLCAISWYHLYNLKNVKNTHKGVLVSVNLYVSDCS